MADILSKSERSLLMGKVRAKGNESTELKLIAIFKRNQITGWRRQHPLVGKPDFVFPKAKLAVFVDGCFWHGCPSHGRTPKTNGYFWRKKIARNRVRDREVNRLLKMRGWRVMRIWEHALVLVRRKQLLSRLYRRLGLRRQLCTP